MAEKQQSEQSWTFIEIYKGKFVERSKEPKPGWVETIIYEKDQKTQKGVTYLRPVYGLEDFYLRAIKYEDKTLADGITRIKSIKVALLDSIQPGIVYQITFRFPDVLTSSFMKLLPNIPFGEPISIDLSVDKNKKNASSLFIRDSKGKNIKTFFNKENPNGMPEAVFDEEEKEWDFKAQNNFLRKNTISISEDLKEYWQQHKERLESPENYKTVAKAKKHADAAVPTEEAPYKPPKILSPQEQLDTFSNPPGEDDNLPF